MSSQIRMQRASTLAPLFVPVAGIALAALLVVSEAPRDYEVVCGPGCTSGTAIALPGFLLLYQFYSSFCPKLAIALARRGRLTVARFLAAGVGLVSLPAMPLVVVSHWLSFFAQEAEFLLVGAVTFSLVVLVAWWVLAFGMRGKIPLRLIVE